MAKTSVKKYLITFLLLIFIGLILSKVSADFFVEPSSSIEIIGDTFTNGELSIRIQNNGFGDGDEIVYTLNGNIPTENDSIYQDPIQIKPTEVTQSIVVRARKIDRNRIGSEVVTRTFFIAASDLDIDQRFSLPIFSISVDEKELYDPQSGIFVEGYGYRGYVESANYYQRGEDWKRNANLEIVSTKGDVISNQEILISVSGRYTSQYSTKSLKIFALPNENIYFNFTSNPFGKSGVPSLYEYDSLVLSNGGNDFLSSMTVVKWGLLSRFALISNNTNLVNSQPVSVFLNGEYYGIMELRENDNADYFSKLYGVENDDIQSFQPAEQFAVSDSGLLPLLQSDLNVQANIIKLESKIDVNAFLKYYAYEYYVNNNDWLNNYNNFKMIRVENGLFTPVMYDLDTVFSFWGDEIEIFTSFDYLDDNSLIFNLLRNNDYKNRFVNYILDLRNYVFSEKNLIDVFDLKYAEINREMSYLAHEHKNEDVRFRAANWEGNYFYFRSDIAKRSDKIDLLLEKYFETGQKYSISIQPPSFGAKIRINSIDLFNDSDILNGEYYREYPIELSYEHGDGTEFLYWNVNGKLIENETLKIPGDVDASSSYEVSLVTNPVDTQNVKISSIYNSDLIDWLEITNTGTTTKSYDSLFISDDIDNLKKVEFNNIEFSVGKKVRVYGKVGSVASYRLSFNFKQGETIYLSDGERIIDSITVPNSNPYQIKTFRSGTKDVEFVKHDFSN